MKLEFKNWLESGFIYQSMTDPVDGNNPSGSEITSDPYVRFDDFPPTKKRRRKKEKHKNKKMAKFGFNPEDGSHGIRKEISSQKFI